MDNNVKLRILREDISTVIKRYSGSLSAPLDRDLHALLQEADFLVAGYVDGRKEQAQIDFKDRRTA